MRKCYTRPCNFYYGSYAKKLIARKKCFPLAGNPNIAFDQIEIFRRKKKRIIKSDFCSINEIKGLDKTILPTIKSDLKKINGEVNNIVKKININ